MGMSGGVILFLFLVAAAVFMLMQGLVVPAFGDHSRERKQLKRRLASIEQELGSDNAASLVRAKFLRDLSPLQRSLESLPGMDQLARLLERVGAKMMPHQLVLLSLLLGVGGALVGALLLKSYFGALLGGPLAAAIPFMKLRMDRDRRAAKLEQQLPDAIDTLRRALRAGHPFNSSIKLVADDMEDPVAHEFALTFTDINYGVDVRRAMLGLLDRVPSVTMMTFVTAVLLQRETGGNLAEILDQIVKVVRGRFKFFRKVKTLSAEGRMSAWILALVPLTLFAALSFVQPGYLNILVEDPLGRKLLATAFVLGLIGVFWIRKILRIEV
jgi:tight adherence protein B